MGGEGFCVNYESEDAETSSHICVHIETQPRFVLPAGLHTWRPTEGLMFSQEGSLGQCSSAKACLQCWRACEFGSRECEAGATQQAEERTAACVK